MHGDVIGAAALAVGRGAIARAGLGHGSAARALTSSGLTPAAAAAIRPTLATLPAGVAQRGIDRALASFAWVDDGWCAGRAAFGAQLVATEALRPVGGLGDAVAGAVAVARGPLQVTAPGVSKRWGYHAALVIQPAGSPTPMAVDGLLFRTAVPLETWARAVGTTSSRLTLRHPTALAGLRIDDDPAKAGAKIATALDATLTHRSKVDGGRINNPLLVKRHIGAAPPLAAPAPAGRQVVSGGGGPTEVGAPSWDVQ